jgi:3-phenylpropionate/cinnamic acid dioxygenase small subunit
METMAKCRPETIDTPVAPELKARVEDLYARYAECICDDAIEQWPDFFTDECLYQIIPRANRDRGLPIAIMLAESRGGLIDRMTAIRNTMVFAPRSVLLTFSGIRITQRAGGILHTRSSFTVCQTLVDEVSSLLMVGRSFDRIDISQADWKFAERVAVYDSELLPATVIYPV